MRRRTSGCACRHDEVVGMGMIAIGDGRGMMDVGDGRTSSLGTLHGEFR